MAIPFLEYGPSSQNQRVADFGPANEEQPRNYSQEDAFSNPEKEELIWAAYRQLFSEHQLLKCNRQTFLESQFKNGQITVKEFVRGLATSDPFYRYNFEPNDNYRFVELCVQRILGRDVYSQREKIAWSIVIVNQGVEGFIDALLASEEYESNFGESVVPYQRRRSMLQRIQGETPFNLKTPRYGEYHRSQLGFPQVVWQNAVRRFVPQETKAAGSPQEFLGMARALQRSVTTPRISTANINIATAVPRR